MWLVCVCGWGGEFGKALQELGPAAHYTRAQHAPAGLRAARHGPPLARTGESPNRPKRSLPTLLKDTLLAEVAARSERRWKAILNECDADSDDRLSRRELLVLLQRLELTIPSDAELETLTRAIDRDENGLMGYPECIEIIARLGLGEP